MTWESMQSMESKDSMDSMKSVSYRDLMDSMGSMNSMDASIILGSPWFHCKSLLESVWGNIGAKLRPPCGRFGVTLLSLWCQFGIILR